jgi:hypothetical protein
MSINLVPSLLFAGALKTRISGENTTSFLDQSGRLRNPKEVQVDPKASRTAAFAGTYTAMFGTITVAGRSDVSTLDKITGNKASNINYPSVMHPVVP